MGFLDTILGSSKTERGLDAMVTAKTNELSALTAKLRTLARYSQEHDALVVERDKLIEQLYQLEKQRHGVAYADRHKVARQRASF